MAITRQEYERLEALEKEMIDLIKTASQDAAATYGRVARACNFRLSRESAVLRRQVTRSQLQAARTAQQAARAARKNGATANAEATPTAKAGTGARNP